MGATILPNSDVKKKKKKKYEPQFLLTHVVTKTSDNTGR